MKAVIALIICLVPSSVLALSPKEAVAQYKSGNAATAVYIKGLVDGLEWANAYLKTSDTPQMFCQPEKLSLTVDQEVDILNGFISEYPVIADTPLGAVFLKALVDTFPCPKSSR